MNPILLSDAYKYTHHDQRPQNITRQYSYIEARPGGAYDWTYWFGLQAILDGPLFTTRITHDHIDEAEEELRMVFGQDYFNRDGWEAIVDDCDGYLPIRIDALPEGHRYPVGNALCTIQNTDPRFAWLPNFCETALLRVWYPTTVATLSHAIHDTIAAFAQQSGASGCTPFHLHDFGYRGVSSEESAGLGAMAHLTAFAGTDTMAGICAARTHYSATGPVGASVRAAEHSTVTSWMSEDAAYREIIASTPDSGIVSIVADSYDIHHAVRHIFGNRLRDQIQARTGTVVVRPDSGDPPTMCRSVLRALWANFGGDTNRYGFRTLDPHIRVIYGDGIDHASITSILSTIVDDGFTTDNLVFGMGGALLQQPNRDTLRFACKASAIEYDDNGEWIPICKTTASDPTKASKAGTFAVQRHNTQGIITSTGKDISPTRPNLLDTVYVNGTSIRRHTWDEVAQR